MAAALAGLFFYSSCSPTEKAETKDYTRYVNTFIVFSLEEVRPIMGIPFRGLVILSE